MKRFEGWAVVCGLSLLAAVGMQAQSVAGAEAPALTTSVAAPPAASPAIGGVSVLRLIKFNGSVADAQGQPLHGAMGITFALYAAQQGGVPLWLETQNVQLDAQGRYTALLGATQNGGLPLEIFSSGEARWLGITVQGQPEQARVLLVAVPYALKAADAETLGGRPPSAFVLAAAPTVSGTETTTGETSTSTSATGGSAQIVSGTVGRIAKFTAADAVGDSVLFEDGTGKIGLGTTTPVEQLDIVGPSRTRINLGNQSTVQFASSGFSMRLTQAVDAHTQWDFFAEKNTAGSATGQTTFQIRRRNSAQTEAVTPILIDKDTNVILQAGFKAGSQTFGNVGIGTAAPTEKLQVLGNIRIAGGGNGLIFPDNSTLLTAAGLGDITAVNTAAGSGLTGGAASGAANLSLLTSCASGELLKWNGSGWACAADDVGGGGGGSGWSLTGNAGTTAGTNFLGTTDSASLVLKVNSVVVGRLNEEAISDVFGVSPSIIFGASTNSVTSGVAGGTISGGGSDTSSFDGNSCTDDFCTVGGGVRNQAGDNAGTTTDRQGATVAGGSSNHAIGGHSFVGGGDGNNASGSFAVVDGGSSNTASGSHSTIAGGDSNFVRGSEATVGGGSNNAARGVDSTVSGGNGNTAGCFGDETFGACNGLPAASAASVSGGNGNSATGTNSAISGGHNNTAPGFAASVSGGENNSATGDDSNVGGGNGNTASGQNSSVVGGANNTASSLDATVGGGFGNQATGVAATVVGGGNNTASGASSLAGGNHANAQHDGSFVWGDDSTNTAVSSTAANQVTFRASGGFRVVDATGSDVFSIDGSGNVNIAGSISKASGTFKIDDPLDPENKYLSHSFVESPDMMNVYNGQAVLNEKGEAVVRLPGYFEALNRDFRYQLTAVGAPMPMLYVAEEIADNQFRIAGGPPGGKVSWQVTGIRHDPYAEAHPTPVEEPKPAAERGTYLHPDAYGQPSEQGANHPRRSAAGSASASAGGVAQ